MEQKFMIMIIDDNPMDQLITSHVLKNEYAYDEIIVMHGALAALDYLENHQDSPAAIPDLILLDLDMPELNGIGFLNRFSLLGEKLRNACRIIVLTASEVREDLAQMREHPYVEQLIAKPLRKSSLIDYV